MAQKVQIVEVAPRDGWQNIDAYIPLELKVDFIGRMIDAGVSRIQLGSFVSPKAVPQMRETGEVVRQILERYPQLDAMALVPNMKGAEQAVAAGLHQVNWVISVSESHNRANVNRSVDESFESLVAVRQAYPELGITLDVATAFSCPFEGDIPVEKLLAYVEKGVAAGVNVLNLCDTIGAAGPRQVEAAIAAVRKAHPAMPLEIHIHDTRNMGILNSWVALQNGVATIQSSLGGLGGCPFAPGASGNTSTEDLVYMLEKSGYDTGIDFERLLGVAREMRTVADGIYSGHHINVKSGPEAC